MKNSESILYIASSTVRLHLHIPLDETIDNFFGNLHNGNKNPPKIPKHDFCNLFNIDTRESFFTFNT